MTAVATPRASRRHVLVTGGGRGLGAAIVAALAADGHDVTFTYRSAVTQAKQAVTELAAAYPKQHFEALPIDLADREAVDAFAAQLEEGSFSGFVHNAGRTSDSLAPIIDQTRAEVAMQVNFWSFARLAGAAVRPMMRARDGRIAVIGSITALRGNQGNAAYAASKAALLGHARTMAVELARTGVTVNYLAPGFIDTNMMAPYADYRDRIERDIPARRYARPEEIASVVAFLMTPNASYLTGAVLPVDGGLSAAIGIHR